MKVIKVLMLLLICSFGAFAQEESEWTLQECIDYALENNLNVKRSLLNVKSQDINYDQSRMARLPNLNADGSYSYSWGRSIDPTTNLFVENQRIASGNGTLSSRVTLFNGFRISNSINQNKLSYEASEQDLLKSKNDVIFNIITFYTNVLFSRELLEIAQSQMESTKQQVELTKKQVDVGALPKSNLLDLLAQQATNELNVVNRENDLQMAKIQLKQVLQLPPASEIDIVVPDMEAEPDPVLDLSAIEIYNIALNSMPEVRSAQLNIESADVGVSVARADLYPTLSLQGGLTTRYSDIADGPRLIPDGGDPVILDPAPVIGFVQGSNTPVVASEPLTRPSGEIVSGYPFADQVNDNLSKFIGMGISIPIFNGFSARAGVQRAVISREQAQINEKDVKYQLWQTIEQAYNDVVAAIKSYNASLIQVEAREESFRVMEQRHELGAVNSTDYQLAQNDLFQAKSDLLRAKYDYIFKLKVLDFYQGKPLDF